MVRKLFSGLTVAAVLALAVGCSSSSSAPQKTDAERKADMDKMKGMMPGGGGAAVPPASAK